MSKTALVIQGGGFRTAFSAGVLDAFMAMNHERHDLYVSVSGGAVTLSYYLAKQYGNCIGAIRLLAEDPEFINMRKLMSETGYMNIDLLRFVAEDEEPLDLHKAFSNSEKSKVHFVLTDRESAEATYPVPSMADWLDLVMASSTLPFVTKGKHMIHGKEYFDGGWSDPIPVRFAYEQGARDICIIRTSPAAMKLTQSWPDYIGSWYFRNNKALSDCFAHTHEIYNDSIDFILDPPKDSVIQQIAPLSLLKSGTYSYSRESILEDYRYGVQMGMDFLVQKRRASMGLT